MKLTLMKKSGTSNNQVNLRDKSINKLLNFKKGLVLQILKLIPITVLLKFILNIIEGDYNFKELEH